MVYCDDYDCMHNQGEACGKEEISVGMKFGEYEAGERICYHNCQDYKERDWDDD